jgi:Tfp pilus assembly protein PilE
MRPTVIIILAVLIAALLAFDAYEYDGHYREAAWEQAKNQAVEIEHTVENWLGKPSH